MTSARGAAHSARADTRADARTARASSGWLAAVGLTAVAVWSYWPTLLRLFDDWQHDDNYSVGQLVPLVALYLVWTERARLAAARSGPCWWGAAVVVAAQLLRGAGLVLFYESLERYALVLTVVGLVLLVAGRKVAWQLRWVLLFLLLAVPLPGRVHNLISSPLQNIATSGAVATLELAGVTVVQEGHILLLNDHTRVAVAEACSGLRMLTAFVVVAATLAFLVRRPGWQRAVLVVSSIPVAIICNLARLVATAVLFLLVSGETAERFFHDFAGLVMMPLAVLLMLVELWVLAQLVQPASVARPAPRRR